jgi:chorismate mutase/prephenate dehydrogenase
MRRLETIESKDETTDPAVLLERHRRDIEALDRRMVHLVRERLELAREIGELKRRVGVPLRNYVVETRVHRRLERACSELGLDPSVGHDLALFLIDTAVQEQASQLDAAYSGSRLQTLVVGGKGGMGSWMTAFLAGQGHRVTVLDPGTGETPFPEVERLDEGARGADLVVVAVPMSETAGVLEELASVGPAGVVAAASPRSPQGRRAAPGLVPPDVRTRRAHALGTDGGLLHRRGAR